MSFPGLLQRAEYGTGLLIRSIKINGKYLLVERCTLTQVQDIDTPTPYLQGGPLTSISEFNAKKISGEIVFPVRINYDGELDPATKILLQHSEKPTSALTIDTNHLLMHYGITAEDIATNNNQLLKITTAVVSSLSISASPGQEIKITATFEGMLDGTVDSNYVVPDDDDYLGRALTWGDFIASREESSMRNVNEATATMTNSIETPSFFIAYPSEFRNDHIGLIGVKGVKWTGRFGELIRVGADLDTFIHGGWMLYENLTLNFGPITATYNNPLFKITQTPLSASVLTRSVEWTGLTNPARPLTAGGLITFS
jgi:hypothetical protein